MFIVKKVCSSHAFWHGKFRAFSLVEMLMALLVASLLLAALAPVMTKRTKDPDIKIMAESAQYDKDSVIQIFTKSGTFNVPTDVNSVKVTMLGGGGAGGDAFWGIQEFKDATSVKSWKVPDGVTKLRVYMVGGGGGGASGGVGSATAEIPAGGDNTYQDFLTAGEHTFSIPSNVTKVPALDPNCAASGITEWTAVSDGVTKYKPGANAISVTACGGGGGGGSGYYTSSKTYQVGGGGGSGGYVKNVQLMQELPSTIYIKVGGGGGGGQARTPTADIINGGYGAGGGGCWYDSGSSYCGKGGTYGGNGGAGSQNGSKGSGYAGGNGTGTLLSYGGAQSKGSGSNSSYTGGMGGRGAVWGGGGGGGGAAFGNPGMSGGGGGGPTTISTSSGTDESKIIFQIGGGGGGGGAGIGSCASGSGGGGGGYGGGGGGGGAGQVWGATASGSATFLSSVIGIGSGHKGKAASDSVYGGGGGAGYGGVDGTNGTNASFGLGGTISNVWGSDYCNGGNGITILSNEGRWGNPGKPGALRLYYTYPALKCSYNLPANGGGGGGAAQITIGEIDVTPGETLYFEVGAGGGTQADAGKDGNPGKVTRIRRGSASGTVIAEALGGNAGKYSKEETVESEGGARLSKRVLIMVNNVENNNGNWMNRTFTGGYGGNNGVLASATTNKGFGGAGGNIQNMKAESVSGGTGGNSVKKGGDAPAENYGAGGGGGAGAQTMGDGFGAGGAGASGYIYIEYGGSNGGGGTSGEYMSKTIYNIKAGTEIPITVGTGGKSGSGLNESGATIYYDGNGGSSSFGDYLTVRGGKKGQNGVTREIHGGGTMLDDDYANYNSDDGASVHGHPGSDIGGGIGGYMEYIYQNPDNTYATNIKSKDGTVAGPPLGGCGGNMSAAGNCNAAASGAQGKPGIFGGGGGGGAVVDGVGGLGGYGGNGVVILEYKSTSM